MLALTKFQTRMALRSHRFLWFGCLLPILIFELLGHLLKGTSYMPLGITVGNYLLPGHVLIIIAYTMTFIFGESCFNYHQEGLLMQYKLMGVSKKHILWSIWMTSLMFQALSIVLLTGLAVLFHGATIKIAQIPFLLIGILCVNGFQFALSYLMVIISDSLEAYRRAALVTFFIQLIFSGIVFPPELFSKIGMQIARYMTPVYYGLIYMRGIWWQESHLSEAFPWLFILIFVSLMVLFTGLYLEWALCKKNRR